MSSSHDSIYTVAQTLVRAYEPWRNQWVQMVQIYPLIYKYCLPEYIIKLRSHIGVTQTPKINLFCYTLLRRILFDIPLFVWNIIDVYSTVVHLNKYSSRLIFDCNGDNALEYIHITLYISTTAAGCCIHITLYISTTAAGCQLRI